MLRCAHAARSLRATIARQTLNTTDATLHTGAAAALDERSRRLRGSLIAIVTLAIAFVLVRAQVRAVSAEALRDVLARVSWAPLFAALGVSLVFKTIHSGLTARYLLRALGVTVELRSVVAATVGGLAVRELLPLGGVNLTRSAYLVRRHGVPVAPASATEVAIVWIKTGWLLLAGMGVLLLPEVDDVYGGVAGVCLLGWLCLTAAARAAADWTLARAARLPRAVTVARRVVSGFTVAERRPLFLGALHCALAATSEWVVFYLVLLAVGCPLPVMVVVTVLPAVSIVTKVPVSFMGVGVRESMVVALFAPYAQASSLLAAGILFSLVDRVVPALLGTAATPTFLSRLAAPPRTPACPSESP